MSEKIPGIRCSYQKLVPIKELKAHPKNRNKHPATQIAQFAKILEYQKIRRPVRVSNLSGFVTSGHGLILAGKCNGYTHMPVDYQDYENEDQEYADLQADNALALQAELDLSGINLDLGDLGPDFDLDYLGLKDFKLDAFEKYDDKDADAVPEVKESICKPGDLWQLGNHRLLCGDSTSKEDVEKLMGGERADMVYTDPPYGMNLDTDYSGMGKTTTTYKPVEGDDRPFDPECVLSIQADEYWLWGADYYCNRIPNYEEGSYVVWTKAHSDEENKVWTSRFELVWVYPKRKKEVWFVRSMQHLHGERTGEHPTQKPIELATRAFATSKSRAELIVDLFLGSGSTLIACEKTNRRCFGMEIYPHYCDVIITRWEKFTGQKGVKL